MILRIASWNVNSVRLRLDHILRFVSEARPDVLCLQEIKCQESEFPRRALAAAGLPHVLVAGQKGWHGVAIASAVPLEPLPALGVCREGQARSLSARVAGLDLHTLYVPAGGDLPDPALNAKFAHKLDFFARLTAKMAVLDGQSPVVLCGDLNVAPGMFDVWSHRQMSKVVSHTPIEIAAMESLRASLGFVDVIRRAHPEPEKVFTWWSYRAADFRTSDRGLRLDHIWVSPSLAPRIAEDPASSRVYQDVRAWTRPSDHVPVSFDLRL